MEPVGPEVVDPRAQSVNAQVTSNHWSEAYRVAAASHIDFGNGNNLMPGLGYQFRSCCDLFTKSTVLQMSSMRKQKTKRVGLSR